MPSRICTAGLGFLPSECPLHFTPLGAARILPYNLGRGGHGSAPEVDRSHLGRERRPILSVALAASGAGLVQELD